MKIRRFCPCCGCPLWKSDNKMSDFRCYNCDKGFSKVKVLRKPDIPQVRKLRHRSISDDLWRGEYPHSHRRPYPRKSKNDMRIKPASNKYTESSLISLNGSYHYDHVIRQSDVDMANHYVRLIESSRSEKQPRNGDAVRLTTDHGDYYSKAHIEKLYSNGFSVCEQPYIPFIYPCPTKNGIICDTSGGAWLSVPSKALKYAGEEEKKFKDWGWRGAIDNGTVCFKATVSVWEYTAPDLLFGRYSTKEWRRIPLMKNENEKADGYLYYGGGWLFGTCSNWTGTSACFTASSTRAVSWTVMCCGITSNKKEYCLKKNVMPWNWSKQHSLPNRATL